MSRNPHKRLITVVGPNTLPDDIWILAQDFPSALVKKAEALLMDVHVRNRNDSCEKENLEDLREKTIHYDIDCVQEIDRNREIAPDEFEMLLKNINDYCIAPFTDKSDAQLRDYIYKTWDLEDLRAQGLVELKDIQMGYEKVLSQVFKIYMLFLRHNKVGKHNAETIANQNMFNRALKIIYNVNQILLSEYSISKAATEDTLTNDEEVINLFQFVPQDTGKNKPFQAFLMFLLRKAYMKGYRLYRECCYKQIYSVGFPTHSWKRVMPVHDFVYDCVSKETNYDMWLNLTDSRDTPKRAAEYLVNSRDKEFPTLQPDRHLFSFTDGVYDAKEIMFYPYETSPLPSSRVAIKFFNQPFEHQSLFSYEEWYDIPTPEFQSILDYQGLSREVCEIIYAMMGRWMYEVNEIDHWEVILFIKGVAGSGKSTIGKQLQSLYPSSEVAVLGSNIEKKFGLSPIVVKLGWICFEVKGNWGLDQGDFQCMISGEDIPIPVKHKEAYTVQWTVPGIMMGNEVARSWLDAAGSMTRRILVVEFPKKVKNTDTTLGARMKERTPAMIHKCNMAYRSLVETCGTASIWDKLPEYFKKTRSNLAAVINPLEDFLENSDQIMVEEGNVDYYIPFEDFQQMYMKFCQNNNYNGIRFNKDHYETVFQAHAMSVGVEREVTYRGMHKKNIKMIYGVKLKEDDTMAINDSRRVPLSAIQVPNARNVAVESI